MTQRYRRRRLALISALALVLPLAVTGHALADPTNNTPAKLTRAVTLDGVLRHLDALQSISNTHGDRVAGRPGYRASVDYVVGRLNAAGYTPSVQAFDFTYLEDNSLLDVLSPTLTSYRRDLDFTYTDFVPRAEGDVTGALQAVDLVLPPTPTPSRGRLRRVRPRQDRVDPARLLQLHRQGRQRAGGGGVGGRDLQRGPARPHRARHPER
jgi:aminopeptidase Y